MIVLWNLEIFMYKRSKNFCFIPFYCILLKVEVLFYGFRMVFTSLLAGPNSKAWFILIKLPLYCGSWSLKRFYRRKFNFQILQHSTFQWDVFCNETNQILHSNILWQKENENHVTKIKMFFNFSLTLNISILQFDFYTKWFT